MIFLEKFLDFQQGKNDLREIARHGFLYFKKYRCQISVSSFILIGLVIFLFPHDVRLLASFHSLSHSSFQSALARKLSFWGDYLTGTLPFAILLWIAGNLFQSRRYQRVAIACLLAASCAGLLADGISAATGRARPSTPVNAGFYGPSLSYGYHSFPSGHSATSIGTAVALMESTPEVGIPVLLIADGVVWSRLQLNRHYFTDVLVGIYLGFIFGLAFGSIIREIPLEK